MNPIIVIVDGYRNGSYYAPHAKKMGYSCVHVQSSTNLPISIISSYVRSDYIESFILSAGNIDEIVNALRKYNILCVIPGTEMGVILADTLSEKLGLQNSNGTLLSEARRNKYKMIEQLKNHNLPSVEHMQTDKVEEVVSWALSLDKWPIVIKPVDDCGTQFITFCYKENEIEPAFHKILENETVMGYRSKKVLAQNFISGTEYVVNTVSCAGKHYLCDLWVYQKKLVPGAGLIYEYIKILPYDFIHKEELVSYVFKVLDALGVKYGAAHSQVFLTNDGPILVETGTRVMGGVSPEIIQKAIERNQLDLSLESYIDPNNFVKDIAQPYKVSQSLLLKFIISYITGKVKSINYLQEINKLHSFYCMNLQVEKGSMIQRTEDLFTSPGVIYLLNKDEKVVMADYEKIAEFEYNMFEVE